MNTFQDKAKLQQTRYSHGLRIQKSTTSESPTQLQDPSSSKDHESLYIFFNRGGKGNKSNPKKKTKQSDQSSRQSEQQKQIATKVYSQTATGAAFLPHTVVAASFVAAATTSRFTAQCCSVSRYSLHASSSRPQTRLKSTSNTQETITKLFHSI